MSLNLPVLPVHDRGHLACSTLAPDFESVHCQIMNLISPTLPVCNRDHLACSTLVTRTTYAQLNKVGTIILFNFGAKSNHAWLCGIDQHGESKLVVPLSTLDSA